jgi:alpha-ketoglutarate-dependent taurine dioxygenase/4-hydroxybenzoate polyprenyltransferase
MSRYNIETLSPFGVIIRNTGITPGITDFTREQIFSWLEQYKLLVFRGFRNMEKQDLALYAQSLGEPYQWVFGAINELKVKPDIENYIYTDREVPLHWDGAFVEKIPYIIFFQCITAPGKEDLGGTTFADTVSLLENISQEKHQEWQKINIVYTTEKIVHYGGKIRQKLVSTHPLNKKPVLRYAEPVYDLNPVSLKIEGLNGKKPEKFIDEMRQLLYDQKFLYTHQWEPGDIVFADNFSLLHGREAFKNPNERYIQRVNILYRPAPSLSRFIKNSFTIRRKEFFVAELPIFLIPVFLSINNWTDFLQPTFYLGLLAVFLLFNIGDMINCYKDYELDSVYKSHLSNAVFELGKKNVKWQIIISGIVAIGLTTLICFLNQQYYLLGITIFGTFIGLQYSMEPFKFKSGGISQLFCLWGIIFLGPMLYTAIITSGFPHMTDLLLFAAYGFHQMGIIMLNTAEDFTEDKQAGLRTIIVALGLQQSMTFAWWLVFISGLSIQGFFLYLFNHSHMPLFMMPVILVFTAGWLRIIYQFRQIIKKIKGKDEEEATKVLKKNGMKVPEWLKIGAYTSLFNVIILFIWKLYF